MISLEQCPTRDTWWDALQKSRRLSSLCVAATLDGSFIHVFRRFFRPKGWVRRGEGIRSQEYIDPRSSVEDFSEGYGDGNSSVAALSKLKLVFEPRVATSAGREFQSVPSGDGRTALKGTYLPLLEPSSPCVVHR